MDASGLHSEIQVLLYLVASQIKIKLVCRDCDNGEVSSGVEGGKLVSPRRRDCWRGPRELIKQRYRSTGSGVNGGVSLAGSVWAKEKDQEWELTVGERRTIPS